VTEPTGWEAAYQNGHTRPRTPHEDAELLVELFRRNGVRRILDLGCGDGRHLVWFGARGFEMFGLDIAPTALARAGEFLAEAKLSAETACSDMSALPWADGFFDAVISVQVINHHDIDGIRKTVAEIHRVLRPGGFLFATVATYLSDERLTSPNLVRLGPRLFTKKEGHEAGVPHYFATEREWVAELSAFEVLDVHKDKVGKTAFLARKQR
jgi:SAM-dependent methyltransferase